MRALLISGGFVDDEFTLNYIKQEIYDVVFAVDRGLGFFARTGLRPDYIVGDFDSVEESVLEEYWPEDEPKEEHLNHKESAPEEVCQEPPEDEPKENWLNHKGKAPKVVRLNPEKDDTDTGHAIQMALDMGCDSIHILGATGTRLDHVLGNLQLLGLALQRQVECFMVDPWNRIRLIDRETVEPGGLILRRSEQFGKYVSLIPYTPKVTGLTLKGFKYPLERHTMGSFYLADAAPISGVSNEITEDEARITLEDGILVLVESRDEK